MGGCYLVLGRCDIVLKQVFRGHTLVHREIFDMKLVLLIPPDFEPREVLFHISWIQKVKNPFIVDLQVAYIDSEVLVRIPFHFLKHVPDCSRNDSFIDQSLLDIKLPFHCKRFPRSCLAIGKDCRVKTL
jgi:hypothetical protein